MALPEALPLPRALQFLRRGLAGLVLGLFALGATSVGAQQGGGDNPVSAGPVRLVAPSTTSNRGTATSIRESGSDEAGSRGERTLTAEPRVQAQASEFERYVQSQIGGETPVRRLGAELLLPPPEAHLQDLAPAVPLDYVVAPGDEVLVVLWGAVEADLRLQVDPAGRIAIPRVGPVTVAGIRHRDLQDAINRRVAQVFRNYNLSVTLGQLRAVRVFVSGQVRHPGIHSVSALSTVIGALTRAGGPTASGSFRRIELRREGRLQATLDLYDLLLNGDRSGDQIIQAGDVIHVGAVGPQIGVIGSVNRQAIVELKPGETVGDALRMVGGPSAVADRSRVALEQLKDRQGQRIVELPLPAGLTQSLDQGDLLRVFSQVQTTLSSIHQRKRIRVEGEVANPGEFVLPASSSLADALRAAGGTTEKAYLYATEFSRESVRVRQQENYDRALREMETDLNRSLANGQVRTTDEANAAAARSASTSRMLERMRQMKPSGRVVLQLTPESTALPDLALEDGDRIVIPARPTTVGVFGSVFNPANYLLEGSRSVTDYLQLAGGPTKTADPRSIFVVRANGSVVSERQATAGWFQTTSLLSGLRAEPGDSVFVPEDMERSTTVQLAKDWTQVLYQFGLGIAGMKALGL